MKVKRTIYLESLDQLDLDNLGCHFSSAMGYIHRNGSQSGTTRKGLFLVEIYVDVDKGMINQEATEQSNLEYPKEMEVVLNTNQSLDVTVSVHKGTQSNGEIVFYRSGLRPAYSAIANTGTRVDDWVKEIK